MSLNVKIVRIKKGIKQYELAEKVGISRYSLSALERGKAKNLSIAVMKAISKELDTPVEELFFN
ncbi:helix-turn-helix transcriptional regulator [Clostridium sp. WILCCON 0269]|uniref:Helix-turn-helix transcriptional regulator n=1 Tax=Candidatus Clostridium eludens TaxID=3381663 RepID=A0ABW8SP74_9CLOT